MVLSRFPKDQYAPKLCVLLLLVNVEPLIKHDRTRTIFTVHPADVIKQGYCVPGFCAAYPSAYANLVYKTRIWILKLSLLEVGEDNSNFEPKKIRKIQIHPYGQTKGCYKGF